MQRLALCGVRPVFVTHGIVPPPRERAVVRICQAAALVVQIGDAGFSLPLFVPPLFV